MAGADRIDPGGRFVEDDKTRVLDDRLGETDALEHSLGIPPEAAGAGPLEIDKVEVAYIALRDAAPQEVIDAIEPLLAMQVRQWVATGELSEGPDGAESAHR